MASLTDPLIKQLLSGRYIATLATHNPDASIHMVAVWYWFDGTNILVATASSTRKARNLQANPHASLMIDSRDPAASFGVTIAGPVQVLTGESSQKCNEEVHRKYLSEAALADARVGPVFTAWDNVTIQLKPVSVFAWDMRLVDQQAFGGALQSNPTYLLPLER
jgi:PPOX class probable F420-dependent enzyme